MLKKVTVIFLFYFLVANYTPIDASSTQKQNEEIDRLTIELLALKAAHPNDKSFWKKMYGIIAGPHYPSCHVAVISGVLVTIARDLKNSTVLSDIDSVIGKIKGVVGAVVKSTVKKFRSPQMSFRSEPDGDDAKASGDVKRTLLELADPDKRVRQRLYDTLGMLRRTKNSPNESLSQSIVNRRLRRQVVDLNELALAISQAQVKFPISPDTMKALNARGLTKKLLK